VLLLLLLLLLLEDDGGRGLVRAFVNGRGNVSGGRDRLARMFVAVYTPISVSLRRRVDTSMLLIACGRRCLKSCL
jgi:hypothetical protein